METTGRPTDPCTICKYHDGKMDHDGSGRFSFSLMVFCACPHFSGDTLATLKKHHMEILGRLDRLHGTLDMLTRMSFRSERAESESPVPKDLKKV